MTPVPQSFGGRSWQCLFMLQPEMKRRYTRVILRQNRSLHAGCRRGPGTQRLAASWRSRPGRRSALAPSGRAGRRPARDPAGQVQHFQEELLFQTGPPGNCRWPAGSGQYCLQSNDDHAGQGMLEVDRGSRVLPLREVTNDLVQIDTLNVRHRLFSVSPPQLKTQRLVYRESAMAQVSRLLGLLEVHAYPGRISFPCGRY